MQIIYLIYLVTSNVTCYTLPNMRFAAELSVIIHDIYVT